MLQYVDFHCDTLMKCFFAQRDTFSDFPEAMIDVQRLSTAQARAQWFAVFFPPSSELPCSDEVYLARCLEIFHNTLTQNNPIKHITSASELDAHQGIAALLSIEDARIINGSFENLQSLYDLGFRMIGLTWNHANCFGYPNSADLSEMALGLTDFGKDALTQIESLGMLVDVSHLSDGGFYDVADVLRGPFIASHSNARAIAQHPRNLTDEMLRILANRGGVAGLNLYPLFLDDCNTDCATLAQMSRMVSHMVNVAGIEAVALGCDFDGISVGADMQMQGCADMPRLYDRLHADGFSEDALERIFYRNALRVMTNCLR